MAVALELSFKFVPQIQFVCFFRDADDAVHDMDGKDMDGGRVRVELARPPGNRDRDRDRRGGGGFGRGRSPPRGRGGRPENGKGVCNTWGHVPHRVCNTSKRVDTTQVNCNDMRHV